MTTPSKQDMNKTPEDQSGTIPRTGLSDTIARLFRVMVIDKLHINDSAWNSYVSDYVRKLFPDDYDNMTKVKVKRRMTTGNTNMTYWRSPTLTFNKFISGLHILRAFRVKITIEAEFKSGKIVEVQEEFFLDTIKDLDMPVDKKPSKSK